MLFDLAYWIILGGAFYIILDAIPNGPLSWKLLSRYASQTELATKILILLGSIVFISQFLFFLIGLYYFYFEDWPMNVHGKPSLLFSLLLIPFMSQLFRIKLLTKKSSGKLFVSTVILLSFSALWTLFPTLKSAAKSDSLLGGLENTIFFNYLCGSLLFFIVLDVVLILKKHKIVK